MWGGGNEGMRDLGRDGWREMRVGRMNMDYWDEDSIIFLSISPISLSTL